MHFSAKRCCKKQTEKLDEITGQLSFFNEAEACLNEAVAELPIKEVVVCAVKPAWKWKKKGQREEDLKDFPQEEICHDIPEEDLGNSEYGARGVGKRRDIQRYGNSPCERTAGRKAFQRLFCCQFSYAN